MLRTLAAWMGGGTLGREKLAADLQSCCSPPYHTSHTMGLVPLADIQQALTSTLRAGRSRRHSALFSAHPSYGISVLFFGDCRLVGDPRPLDPLGGRVPGPHPQPEIAGQGLNLGAARGMILLFHFPSRAPHRVGGGTDL